MTFTRRRLLKLAGLSPLTQIVGLQIAHAEDRSFSHAITLFDDIKYPPDFRQFDYVNPTAPKGGRVRFGVVGSFDSLNGYSYKGEAFAAAANEALFDRSLDEPSTSYGLIAASVWYPEDRAQVVYRLRPEARFHDGTPVTPEDVVWSMMTLREINPNYNAYYKNVSKAEQTGDHEVTFVFSETGNRELPVITSGLPVLPKAWWTGKDAAGKDRNIAEATLELPLGSGPYRAAEVKPGALVTLKRVEDYWGKDLPVNVGMNNLDEIQYVFFRDANVAVEALKGDQFDWRVENSSKMWATGYDFPAARDGSFLKEEFHLKQVNGMQAWVLNLRRDKFKDVRVRRALNLAFDFEWSNANLFYGQYTRSRSFFNNSDMEAKGLPSPEELALLEPLKDQLPPELFSTEYANPVNDTPQNRRANLRAAAQLLDAAGWKVTQEGNRSVLKNDKGEKLEVGFLLDSPLFERIALPYQQQLEMLGITVTVQTVDSAQYERQTQTFDYDIISNVWGQSLSPGNEQRDFWGSAAAAKPGSRNYAGIADPAIDQLIEKLIFVKDRKALIAACRALDRALIWNQFMVPMWFLSYERVGHWDRFGRPARLPEYSDGFPGIWWWDAEKAKKTGGA